jgi:hypothetical protein
MPLRANKNPLYTIGTYFLLITLAEYIYKKEFYICKGLMKVHVPLARCGIPFGRRSSNQALL